MKEYMHHPEETAKTLQHHADGLTWVCTGDLGTMTREEAVMQMNLLEHNFFAFRDEDNGGSVAVVYRRNDGGYGLIDDAE